MSQARQTFEFKQFDTSQRNLLHRLILMANVVFISPIQVLRSALGSVSSMMHTNSIRVGIRVNIDLDILPITKYKKKDKIKYST